MEEHQKLNGLTFFNFFFALHRNRLNIVSRVRTLPGKHLEEIAEQLRIHNINALMVIGGFEVSLSPSSLRFLLV